MPRYRAKEVLNNVNPYALVSSNDIVDMDTSSSFKEIIQFIGSGPPKIEDCFTSTAYPC